jgi:hypothetical protein
MAGADLVIALDNRARLDDLIRAKKTGTSKRQNHDFFQQAK